MIEKIMRAVKTSNKKRGRNITIGAVIGMLLSCSVVIKADDYLWIKNNNGVIEFSIDGNSTGTGETWKKENPYDENSWNGKTYINNMTLYGEDNGEELIEEDGYIGYGLRLSGNLGEVEFINNGSIFGEGRLGYGLHNENGSIGSILNNGIISGRNFGIYNYSIGSGSNSYIGSLINKGSLKTRSTSGIYNYSAGSSSSVIGSLKNNGTISGSNGIYNYSTGSSSGSSVIGSLVNSGSISSWNFGINNKSEDSGSSTIKSLINSGNIVGKDNGIRNDSSNSSSSTIESLINTGIISGDTYGIYNSSYNSGSISIINSLINTGVIYGKTNTVNNKGGTINNAYNYGLLVSEDDSVVKIDGGTVDFIKSYGLAFKAESGKYTLDKNYSGEFGKAYIGTDVVIGYEKDEGKFDFKEPITGKYTIINAKEKTKDSSNEIIGTESLTLEKGKLTYYDSGSFQTKAIDSDKKYILNGITNTLEVAGKHNKLNNSIVNAYGTAVVMKGESNLTLENTIVNGGLDREYDLNIGEYINCPPTILVTGDNNFLTIKGDSIINGDMKADGEKNTLNLYGKQNMTRSSDSESMNILHDIDGFGRIQIENEVTFFEDVKVTGVDRININEGGTLSLRLKAGETSNTKATHALNDHADGANDPQLLIAGKEEEGSENAGTLNFIANGIGTGAVVDMGGIKLENVYLRANSIVYNMKVIEKGDPAGSEGDIILDVGESLNEVYNKKDITPDEYPKDTSSTIPDIVNYNSLNKIYKSSVAVDDNVDAITDMIGSASDEEQWEKLLTFLGGIYTESPYSYSSELSRRSVGMFRDIITENEFRPNLNNWLIMGGLTHADGGTKDTYYGKNYYKIDSGSSTTNADMKLTGAYMLTKYGYSENLSLGLTLGGNKSEAKLSMSKVKGNSGYLGAFAENYRGNLTLKAGAGVQYSEYDADRSTLGGHSYSDKYSDMTYDIYLNGRYSHQVGDNLFLEPYATLSYTYTDQDGANEGSKALAIETDSKSFDYTVGKVGVDLKKIIPHEKGKSTLTAGVSNTKILDGAEEEYITGRFKGGSDFDILVAHKNEHSIGLNAKYALELENGILFDVKGTYSVERDSHNGSGKNKAKGEWIAGAGMGYKF